MAKYSRDPSVKRYGPTGFDQQFNQPVSRPPQSREITNPRDTSLLIAGAVPALNSGTTPDRQTPSWPTANNQAAPTPPMLPSGLPEGIQQQGNTFTNRGWQGGVPGMLREADPSQQEGPASQVGGYMSALPQTPQTSFAGQGGASDWMGGSPVSKTVFPSTPAPAGGWNAKYPNEPGFDAAGNRTTVPYPMTPPGTLGTPTPLRPPAPQPPFSKFFQDKEAASNLGELVQTPMGPGHAESGGSLMPSPLPGVQAAGDEAARKAFPLTGLPTEVAGNYMDYLNNMIQMGTDPEYRGQVRASNWINNAMQMMAQNPEMGVSTVEKIPQGMKTLTLPGGQTFTASRVGTKTTASPMEQMFKMAGIQADAAKQGDASTAAAAGELFSLLNTEAQQEGGLAQTQAAAQGRVQRDPAADAAAKNAMKIVNEFASDESFQLTPELEGLVASSDYNAYKMLQQAKARRAERAKSTGARTSRDK